MTNILVIGDVVRTTTGFDMIVRFTPEDKVVLDRRGVSDNQYFDVIGHYNPDEGGLIIHDTEGSL